MMIIVCNQLIIPILRHLLLFLYRNLQTYLGLVILTNVQYITRLLSCLSMRKLLKDQVSIFVSVAPLKKVS